MISNTLSASNFSDFTTAITEGANFNVSAVNATQSADKNNEYQPQILLDFVILPLSIVGFFLLLLALIALLIRKRRLDRLRHHLMPLYSFDPAEEGEDWEAELLEEGTDHQPVRRSSRPSDLPQLSFKNNI